MFIPFKFAFMVVNEEGLLLCVESKVVQVFQSMFVELRCLNSFLFAHHLHKRTSFT